MSKFERSGLIRLFDPELRAREVFRRRLWLHAGLVDWVQARPDDQEARKFHADIRAFLKLFVIGGDFDDDFRIKPIGRDGIWELRITFNPQHRIFGGFTQPGEFVATNVRSRRTLEKAGFVPARDRCRSIWTMMHPVVRSRLGRQALLEDFAL